MTRSLIAIGCSTYLSLQHLAAAELDATTIFKQLVGTGKFDYRGDASELLLSPSLSEVTAAVDRVAQSSPTAVTLYFAGHAESDLGSLYLKVKDTNDRRLPTTAIVFGNIVTAIAKTTGVMQLNIVIDACHSSGILRDLARLLSDQVRTSAGDVGLSILAAAGPAQPAKETAAGGRLTTAVIDILDGKVAAQGWRRFLDLRDIFDAVCRVPTVKTQDPSYWGLNIVAPSQFARNPSYDPVIAAVAAPDELFGGATALSASQTQAIRRFLQSVTDEGYTTAALRQLQGSLADLPIGARLAAYVGLSDSVALLDTSAVFSPPPRRIMIAEALLSISNDASAKNTLAAYFRPFPRECLTRLLQILPAVRGDERELINLPLGFSALYFLPLELTALLGWIGYCATYVSSPSSDELSALRELLGIVLRAYGNSIVCIEDSQAPSVLSFIIGMLKVGWRDELEEVLGRLFHSASESGGRVARAGLGAEEKIEFLLSQTNVFLDLRKLEQRPSELVLAVLFGGALCGLDPCWDPHLMEMDHVAVNMFVPSDPWTFADVHITSGDNLTLRIGHEFHSLADLRQFIKTVPRPSGEFGKFRAEMDALALSLQDRCNWVGCLMSIDRQETPLFVPRIRLSALAADGTEDVLFDQPGTAGGSR